MENNDRLKEMFKFRISLLKIKNEYKIFSIKKSNYLLKKLSIVASIIFILTGGIVFANNIQNIQDFLIEKFGFGMTIAKIAEKGYVAHSNTNFINSSINLSVGSNPEILDTFNVKARTKDFIINDSNLYIEFELQFDRKINEYKYLGRNENGNIDYENFGTLIFSNMCIMDEKDKIIWFSGNEEKFNAFCKEHNLNYKFDEFNDYYLFSGGVCQITEIDDTTNTIKLSLNCGTDNKMPDSKDLKIYLNELTFIPKNYDENKNVILKGNWEFKLNVPEVMYNRKNYEIDYKVTNCKNKDFEIYESKVTNTGFEVGIRISNVKKPENKPKELSKKEVEFMESHPNTGIVINTKEDFINVYGDDPKYEDMYVNYFYQIYPINLDGWPGVNWRERTSGCYVLNSNDKRFNFIKGAYNTHRNCNWIEDEENVFDFHEFFDMLPDDATDKITLIIDFHAQPVKIELEKI